MTRCWWARHKPHHRRMHGERGPGRIAGPHAVSTAVAGRTGDRRRGTRRWRDRRQLLNGTACAEPSRGRSDGPSWFHLKDEHGTPVSMVVIPEGRPDDQDGRAGVVRASLSGSAQQGHV